MSLLCLDDPLKSMLYYDQCPNMIRIMSLMIRVCFIIDGGIGTNDSMLIVETPRMALPGHSNMYGTNLNTDSGVHNNNKTSPNTDVNDNIIDDYFTKKSPAQEIDYFTKKTPEHEIPDDEQVKADVNTCASVYKNCSPDQLYLRPECEIFHPSQYEIPAVNVQSPRMAANMFQQSSHIFNTRSAYHCII